MASRAYEDTALPIGKSQTISQPWVVARMTEALIEHTEPAAVRTMRVLEIGTGSGYQAAVLSLLVGQVYTVERIEELLRTARKRFRKLGFANIRTRHDDGRIGWPDHAPFDAIIVTAAGAALDPALLEQLAVGGALVAPVGGDWLWMVLAGTGGGMFPVALTLIGLRARETETTAGLSAFVQTRGYVLAGTGPLLFGVLHGATNSWVLPMATLFVALGISVVAGWLAAAPRYVDDELATV